MKKKILHIITSIDNGGAENHLADLIHNQLKIYEVFLIYFKGNNFHRKELENKGAIIFKINILNKNLFLLFLGFFKVLKIFKKTKPDIVHCHLWISEIYGFLLKVIFKDKIFLIVTKHLDSYIFEASFGKKEIIKGIFLEKIIFKLSDHIIFISKSVKNYFVKKINVNNKKFSIVHYGINAKKFSKITNDNKIFNLKNKLCIDKNAKVIGCVARHVSQKNLEALIRAYAKFCKDNYKINSKLIMIGRGYLTSELKKLSNELNVNKKIIWVPYVSKINNYYKIFDVFCLTSQYEGFGLVLLEAFAFGLPIVAFRSGAIPEIIHNNKTGYLVKFNDIDNFVCRLKDSFNPSKNKIFKRNQLIHLKKKYTLKQVFFKVDEIYKNFLV
jgi:glycosyltransferase involved in cell wall biosynthesis